MIGTPFGRYRLLETLGAGGMAQVYRAESEPVAGIRRTVAIKKITRGAWGEGHDMNAMLLDEARVWVRLHHPNIVSVVDFGDVEGEWFLALELVEGSTAEELVGKTGALPALEALCIADRVARALGHAHALRNESGIPLRVVHRDVKPSNVLVSIAGEVKLTDFGIARAADKVSTTNVGFVKGSLYYFSPEQVRGEPLDGRSDLFALGCVLHELLTGRMLFQGTRAQVMHDVAAGRIPRPPSRLPPGIRELMGGLLAASREDRIQSAEDAVSAIRALLAPRAAEDLESRLAERVAIVRGAGDIRVPTRPLRPETTPPPRPGLDAELPSTRLLHAASTVPSERRTARQRRLALGGGGLASVLLAGALLYRMSEPPEVSEAPPPSTNPLAAVSALPVVETLAEIPPTEAPPSTPEAAPSTRVSTRVRTSRPSNPSPIPTATLAAVMSPPAVTRAATPAEDTDADALRRAQEVVARAVKQHRGGDALGAIRALDDARKGDPQNGHLLFLAGSELYSLREIGAALRMYRHYLDAPAAVFRNQDPEQRAQNLDHVRYVIAETDRLEQSEDVWLSTCRTLRDREGLIEQAARELERLVARHPRASQAWFELATTRSALRKYEGTCAAFSRFLELVPAGDRADYARRERAGLRCP